MTFPMTIIFACVIVLSYLLDILVFVPKGVNRFTKAHLIDGDKTGYVTQALRLSYSKIKKGQIWRLFTEVFLHSGIMHLVANMLAFLPLGYALELTIGWQKALLGYVISSIFSSCIMAFVVKLEDGEGASTGIFGWIAMYIIVAVQRHTIFFSPLHWLFVLIIGIYTVVGLVMNKLNFQEHITGFIGGLIAGVILLVI